MGNIFPCKRENTGLQSIDPNHNYEACIGMFSRLGIAGVTVTIQMSEASHYQGEPCSLRMTWTTFATLLAI